MPDLDLTDDAKAIGVMAARSIPTPGQAQDTKYLVVRPDYNRKVVDEASKLEGFWLRHDKYRTDDETIRLDGADSPERIPGDSTDLAGNPQD